VHGVRSSLFFVLRQFAPVYFFVSGSLPGNKLGPIYDLGPLPICMRTGGRR
jgi:hypothetical protein